MVEVPADRGGDAGIEVVPRLPAELAPGLAVVDGIAAVVPRTIGDEALQVAGGGGAARRERRGCGGREGAVRPHAELVDDLQVGAFAAPAEVVLLAGPAMAQGGE